MKGFFSMNIVFAVPTLSRFDLLGLLLDSVKKNSVLPDEILIIDNSNGKMPFMDFVGNIPVKIVSFDNIGVSGAWNYAIDYIEDEDLVIICNDDNLLSEDAIQSFKEGALANPWSPMIQSSGCGFSCFAVRGKIKYLCGYFDEAFYPAYHEDSDYHQRLIRSKASVFCIDKQVVVLGVDGKQSQTVNSEKTSPSDQSLVKDGFKLGQQRIARKWGKDLSEYETPFNGPVHKLDRAYVIPTIRRSTIVRAIDSIQSCDPEGKIFIGKDKTVGPNRNDGIEQALKYNPHWIIFLDDDDYFLPGYVEELDPDFDVIVFRMDYHGFILPRRNDNELKCGNLGINFALNLRRLSHIPFFEDRKTQDWVLLRTLLREKPDVKHKVTEDIFYMAPKANKFQPVSGSKKTSWQTSIYLLNLALKKKTITYFGKDCDTQWLVDRFKSVRNVKYSKENLLPLENLGENYTCQLIEMPESIKLIDKEIICTKGEKRDTEGIKSEVNRIFEFFKEDYSDLLLIDFGAHFRGEFLNFIQDYPNWEYVLIHDYQDKKCGCTIKDSRFYSVHDIDPFNDVAVLKRNISPAQFY